MKKLTLVAMVILLCSASANTYASKEGILVWSKFTVESEGIGNSGPITITGIQGKEGISSLSIKAFGREFVLSEGKLNLLKDIRANGMQLSYEAGYKERGERTIYILFSKGFTSGDKEKRYIILQENGTINVK